MEITGILFGLSDSSIWVDLVCRQTSTREKARYNEMGSRLGKVECMTSKNIILLVKDIPRLCSRFILNNYGKVVG